jgi:hypothetical protein
VAGGVDAFFPDLVDMEDVFDRDVLCFAFHHFPKERHVGAEEGELLAARDAKVSFCAVFVDAGLDFEEVLGLDVFLFVFALLLPSADVVRSEPVAPMGEVELGQATAEWGDG